MLENIIMMSFIEGKINLLTVFLLMLGFNIRHIFFLSTTNKIEKKIHLATFNFRMSILQKIKHEIERGVVYEIAIRLSVSARLPAVDVDRNAIKPLTHGQLRPPGFTTLRSASSR